MMNPLKVLEKQSGFLRLIYYLGENGERPLTEIMDDASNAAKMDRINILRSKDGPRQRVVSVYALEAYINEGFVSNGNVLPGEKVLVEFRNGH